MIDRYSRAPMRELWSEQRKFEIWLEIETQACEAMAALGQIPQANSDQPSIYHAEARPRRVSQKDLYQYLALLALTHTLIGGAPAAGRP